MYEAVMKTYRGERPLVVTYWLWGVFPGFFFTAAYIVLQAFYLRLDFAGLATPIYYLLLAVHGAFVCFVSVAVWNSSEKYTGHTFWKVLARIAVVVSVISYVKVLMSLLPTNSPVTAREMQEQLGAMNVGLPVMVDDETELTRLTLKETEVTFHYTLVGMNESEIDDGFSARLQGLVIENMCGEDEVRQMLRRGATFRNKYSILRDGNAVAEFVVTDSSCAK